jgi:hypothetical protein
MADRVLIYDQNRGVYGTLAERRDRRYELAYVNSLNNAGGALEAGDVSVLVAEVMDDRHDIVDGLNPASAMMLKAKAAGVTVVLHSDVPEAALQSAFGVDPKSYDHFAEKSMDIDPLAKLVDQCLAERAQ